MTKIFHVRHGMNDFIGKRIAGRKPGVHLNAEGQAQAQRLVARLTHEKIDRAFSSPLERCQETAAPFALKAGLKVELLPNVAEIDYGDWTGQTIEEVKRHPAWEKWNSFRTGSRVPNGETMLEIQSRMVGEVQRLHATFPGQTLALFSHGDPIKTVILFALGIPLDFFQRLEISPASISLICLGDDFVQVGYVNDQAASRDL
ncbi:MAG: Phosphoglycerate mutase [Verrucomicrobiales bacterium]|nr:Phosphoglycerate mutase [Verrucomicrobiales bacterium]